VRNNGYFKGTNPDWLCGTPEPYNFVQRSKIFRKSSLGVYAQTAVSAKQKRTQIT
jgi:hypothetical protein